MSPLLNVWKFFGKLRKKHRRVQITNIPTSFRKFKNFLKIFGNLRKSSEISESLRKSSEKIGKCRKVLKTTFQHFLNIFKSSEIIRSLRKSSDVFGNLRKTLEIVAKCLKQPSSIFKNVLKPSVGNCRKSSEIFASLRKKSENAGKFSKRSSDTFWKFSKTFRKSSEVFENGRKISETLGKYFECNWSFMKFLYFEIFSLTSLDWRSDSRILICNLNCYYTFARLLLFHCTALSESESSTFFMYVIMRAI